MSSCACIKDHNRDCTNLDCLQCPMYNTKNEFDKVISKNEIDKGELGHCNCPKYDEYGRIHSCNHCTKPKTQKSYSFKTQKPYDNSVQLIKEYAKEESKYTTNLTGQEERNLRYAIEDMNKGYYGRLLNLEDKDKKNIIEHFFFIESSSFRNDFLNYLLTKKFDIVSIEEYKKYFEDKKCIINWRECLQTAENVIQKAFAAIFHDPNITNVLKWFLNNQSELGLDPSEITRITKMIEVSETPPDLPLKYTF